MTLNPDIRHYRRIYRRALNKLRKDWELYSQFEDIRPLIEIQNDQVRIFKEIAKDPEVSPQSLYKLIQENTFIRDIEFGDAQSRVANLEDIIRQLQNRRMRASIRGSASDSLHQGMSGTMFSQNNPTRNWLSIIVGIISLAILKTLQK